MARSKKVNAQVISAILGSTIAVITLSGMLYPRHRKTKNAVKQKVKRQSKSAKGSMKKVGQAESKEKKK